MEKTGPCFLGESVRKASTIVESAVLEILVSVEVVRNILPSRYLAPHPGESACYLDHAFLNLRPFCRF